MTRLINIVLLVISISLAYLWLTDEPLIQVEPTITVNPPSVETEITHPALSRDGAEGALRTVWTAVTGQ